MKNITILEAIKLIGTKYNDTEDIRKLQENNCKDVILSILNQRKNNDKMRIFYIGEYKKGKIKEKYVQLFIVTREDGEKAGVIMLVLEGDKVYLESGVNFINNKLTEMFEWELIKKGIVPFSNIDNILKTYLGLDENSYFLTIWEIIYRQNNSNWFGECINYYKQNKDSDIFPYSGNYAYGEIVSASNFLDDINRKKNILSKKKILTLSKELMESITYCNIHHFKTSGNAMYLFLNSNIEASDDNIFKRIDKVVVTSKRLRNLGCNNFSAESYSNREKSLLMEYMFRFISYYNFDHTPSDDD